MSSRKATIINAEYKADNDLMIWTLRFHDEEDGNEEESESEEQSYCWPSRDYLENVVKIAVPSEYDNTKIVSDLDKHCKEMINKEITFTVNAETISPMMDKARMLSSGNIEDE